jgi:hypothetical protein
MCGFGAVESTLARFGPTTPKRAGRLADASVDPVEESEASAGRLDRGTHAEHIEVLTHVQGTGVNRYGDTSGMANLSVEERML